MPSDFNNDRTLPRNSFNAGVRRGSRNASRASSLRLSIIEEDANYVPLPPTSPAKTHHRPFHRRFLGEPPSYSGQSTPPYSLWDVRGPKAEKMQGLRNNRFTHNRGGPWRICLIAVITIACIVALVVGLAVGLHKKHNNSNNNSNNNATPSAPSSSSSPSANGPFPIGSWTFTTFLDTVSTNCTSNPSSWKCEPSVTYATSPTNAQAPFNWIISSADPNPNPNPNPDSSTSSPSSTSNLTISSTDNPFAINFSNVTLRLVDAGTPDERYTFSTTVQKVVFPTFNVKCFYNDTVFMADLYTSKANSYPTGNGSPTRASASASATPSAGGAFADWRFAMDATQHIGGGVDVPACYNLVNGQPADRITSGYSVMPPENFCSCAYKNYDP